MGLAEEDGFHLGDSSYRVTMMVCDLGWVDSGLGGSLGFLDATAATYCPGRMVEHPKSKSTHPESLTTFVTIVTLYKCG